jgi:hypothetical protein
MKIPLNVKFEEKEEAKNNGAQWDSKNKLWYLWDYLFNSYNNEFDSNKLIWNNSNHI